MKISELQENKHLKNLIEPLTLGVYVIRIHNSKVYGRNIFIRNYPFSKTKKIDVHLSKSPFELNSDNFIMQLDNSEQLLKFYLSLNNTEKP